MIERDGKRWTVADIDALERERDDYKDRWETLGRVSKRMIDKRDERLEGAVEALASARIWITATGLPCDAEVARIDAALVAIGGQ